MTRTPDDVPEGERDDIGGGVDVEAAWAQIVARWSEEAAGHPQPRDDTGEDLDGVVLDVTDPADLARAGLPPESPEDSDSVGSSGPGDVASRRATDVPDDETELYDYPTRPTRHRLTPEEVAQLAEEGWSTDPEPPAEDRRPTRDWRRSWHAPTSSHVGGEEARSGHSASLDDDEDDGFVPPEPPPLPRGDLVSTVAWVSALGAPLFLLLAALFWRSAPSMLVGAAVVAFIAGFVTLVVRMPDRSDDGDDGAVV